MKGVHTFQFHSHFDDSVIPVYNAIGFQETFKTTELLHIYDKMCAHHLTYHRGRRGTLFNNPNDKDQKELRLMPQLKENRFPHGVTITNKDSISFDMNPAVTLV